MKKKIKKDAVKKTKVAGFSLEKLKAAFEAHPKIKTQASLSKKSGIQPMAVSTTFRGITQPTFESLKKYAKALGCKAEDFIVNSKEIWDELEQAIEHEVSYHAEPLFKAGTPNPFQGIVGLEDLSQHQLELVQNYVYSLILDKLLPKSPSGLKEQIISKFKKTL